MQIKYILSDKEMKHAQNVYLSRFSCCFFVVVVVNVAVVQFDLIQLESSIFFMFPIEKC